MSFFTSSNDFCWFSFHSAIEHLLLRVTNIISYQLQTPITYLNECRPTITSILRELLRFNTLLIFIPQQIFLNFPSNKPNENFDAILAIYSTKVVVMLVGCGYCTHTHAH
jgi:hypothetical protein